MNLFFAERRPYPENFEEELRKLGLNVFMGSEKEAFAQPEIIDLMIGSRYFMKQEYASFSNLKFLQLNSAGYDKIPIEQLKAMGVTICNARGVYGAPIAEWVVMQWLMALKQTREVWTNQQDKQWKHRNVREAQGDKILILGTGDIASEVAKRMKPFGVEITGTNTDGRKIDGFDFTYPLNRLDEYIADYDCVIITLPLNESTRNLIDENMLARMKPSAGIINIGRGGIIVEDALVSALNAQRIAYAALDVFAIEPLPIESKLWDALHCVVSPHISYSGQFTKERLAKLTIENLTNFLEGKETRHRL